MIRNKQSLIKRKTNLKIKLILDSLLCGQTQICLQYHKQIRVVNLPGAIKSNGPIFDMRIAS